MNIVAKDSDSWLTQHANANLTNHNLEWLNQQRKQALQHFEKVGLPGVRDEQWRYTNLSVLKNKVFDLSSPSVSNTDLTNILADNGGTKLVFVDGHFSQSDSILQRLPEEVTLLNLSQTLANSPDLIEHHFGSTIPSNQHGFTALNSAYCQDGYVLIIPNGVTLEEPIEIVFFTNNNDAQVSHNRNLVIAETNSKCTVIERYIGADNGVYLNNSVTEIIAADNAHIDHYKIQQESNEAFHIGGVFICQAANAHVKNHNIALSGLVTRNDITADLTAPGSHIEMNGLVLGSDRQHFDNHTQVNHLVPHCTSDEYYKTILDDKSRSIFRGRIVVAEDAQQTNADQQNNNLLLSKGAEADTLPQLEIYADDVKCSHGATVGQLDEASLFYLRSRGISLESATSLLTIGFANEVIDRIQVSALREEITQQIVGQLLSSTEV